MLSPNTSWAALGYLWSVETLGYSLVSLIFSVGVLHLTPEWFLFVQEEVAPQSLWYTVTTPVSLPVCSDWAQLCINVLGLSTRLILMLNYFCSKAKGWETLPDQPGAEGWSNRCPSFLPLLGWKQFLLHVWAERPLLLNHEKTKHRCQG